MIRDVSLLAEKNMNKPDPVANAVAQLHAAIKAGCGAEVFDAVLATLPHDDAQRVAYRLSGIGGVR